MTKRKKLNKEQTRARNLLAKASMVRRRAVMVNALGGRCQKCGGPGEKLKPKGDGYDLGGRSKSARLALYRRLLDAGKLRLLCAGCCSMTGAHYGRERKSLF
jgi:hypothetical protein